MGRFTRRLVLDQWYQPGQPSAFYMYYGYDSMDAKLGRPSQILDWDLAPVVGYEYMGSCQVVAVQYQFVSTKDYGTGLAVAMRSPTEMPETIDGEIYSLGVMRQSNPYDGGLDRFNRPARHQWAKGSLPFVSQTFSYTPDGQIDAMEDGTLRDASGTPNFDAQNSYNGLHQLIRRQEGDLGIGTSRDEYLSRNLAGRVVEDKVDLNGDTTFLDLPNAIDAGEMNDNRTTGYNLRNELRTRHVADNSNHSPYRTVTLDYDYNGNLIDDGEKFTYKYDVWGRLVEIHDWTTTHLLAKYTYNGLGQRITEQTDTNDTASNSGVTDDNVNGDDPIFYIANDLSGRRIATYRNTDTYPKETFLWHPAGMGGPSFRGGLAYRERDSTLDDPTQWALAAGVHYPDQRAFASSDTRGNVVALTSGTGKLVEQYRYSATGVPICLALGDVNGDGLVDSADSTEISGAGSYAVRYDLDLDGDVDSDDVDIADANALLGVAGGRGKFSAPGVMNRVGFGNRTWSLVTAEQSLLGMRQAWSLSAGSSISAPTPCPSYVEPSCVDAEYSLQGCITCCASRADAETSQCVTACMEHHFDPRLDPIQNPHDWGWGRRSRGNCMRYGLCKPCKATSINSSRHNMRPPLKKYSCEGVMNWLRETQHAIDPIDGGCPQNSYPLYVVANDGGFHIYRQNPNSFWTDKPGNAPSCDEPASPPEDPWRWWNPDGGFGDPAGEDDLRRFKDPPPEIARWPTYQPCGYICIPY